MGLKSKQFTLECISQDQIKHQFKALQSKNSQFPNKKPSILKLYCREQESNYSVEIVSQFIQSLLSFEIISKTISASNDVFIM